MRDQYNPELRTKNQVRNNSNSQQISDQLNECSKKGTAMNNKQNGQLDPKEGKKFRSGRKFREQGSKQEPEAKKTLSHGLNVFYTGLGLGNRHKLSVSHYEIQVTPDEVGASYADWALRAARNPRFLPLGGEKFRVKVRAAAMQALSNVTDVATTTVDVLTNDFYRYLYNARTLYALLCTMHRCQQCVNVMDEDGLRLAAILNIHGLVSRTVGWSYDTYAVETNMNTFAALASRQGLTFSMAISNGAWSDSIVAPIIENSRLPKGWREWIEAKFKYFHVVKPTDYSATPRVVAFWPTASYITDDGSGNSVLNYFTGYYSSTNLTPWFCGSPTLAQIQTFIDNVTTDQEQILARNKYVNAMLTALECEFSTTDFNRDIRKETMPMTDSFDVRPFINSTSTGMYQHQNSDGSNYVKTSLEQGNSRFNYIYVERDPKVQFFSDPYGRPSDNKEGAANMVYASEAELDEADYCMCSSLVSPISMAIIVGSSTDAFYRWALPLDPVLGYLTSAIGGFTTDSRIMTAELELQNMIIQGMGVVGRARYTCSGNGGANGILRVAYTPNRFLDLKDYLVDNRIAQGWSNDYADTLSLG